MLPSIQRHHNIKRTEHTRHARSDQHAREQRVRHVIALTPSTRSAVVCRDDVSIHYAAHNLNPRIIDSVRECDEQLMLRGSKRGADTANAPWLLVPCARHQSHVTHHQLDTADTTISQRIVPAVRGQTAVSPRHHSHHTRTAAKVHAHWCVVGCQCLPPHVLQRGRELHVSTHAFAQGAGSVRLPPAAA